MKHNAIKRDRVKTKSKVRIIKSLIQAVLVAAFAISAVSFAQSNQPLTRAQVKAELVQVEAAGYDPATANDYNYSANIHAAEARVVAQNDATTAYGGLSNGTSDSGSKVHTATGDNVRSVKGH